MYQDCMLKEYMAHVSCGVMRYELNDGYVLDVEGKEKLGWCGWRVRSGEFLLFVCVGVDGRGDANSRLIRSQVSNKMLLKFYQRFNSNTAISQVFNKVLFRFYQCITSFAVSFKKKTIGSCCIQMHRTSFFMFLLLFIWCGGGYSKSTRSRILAKYSVDL